MNDNHLSVTGIVEKLSIPSINNAERFGFHLPGTGNGTKFCLIDSGLPEHDAIVNIGGNINFTKSETSIDLLGHSTVLSGIISGNKPDCIQGVAPDATSFFAKSTSDDGMAAFNATIASVLWGIIVGVDIILLPLAIESRNTGLQDAINKAAESNINTVMALPSTDIRYENVLYASPLSDDVQTSHFIGPNVIASASKNFESTFLEKKYAKVAGPAIAAAVISGICLLAVEQMKKGGVTTDYKSLLACIAKSLPSG